MINVNDSDDNNNYSCFTNNHLDTAWTVNENKEPMNAADRELNTGPTLNDQLLYQYTTHNQLDPKLSVTHQETESATVEENNEAARPGEIAHANSLSNDHCTPTALPGVYFDNILMHCILYIL